MNKLLATTFLVAMLLVSITLADHHKPDEKLVPIDNVASELKMPGLESILDGLRVRRAAQGQGNGGRRGQSGDGQGNQRGGQSGQSGGGQSGQNSGGN
ncbi:single-stranded DNA-binding protein-like [Anopheles coustani]|uniref:single-stranded DNA-binding protein-like n=1 Tax=Anopheles coustani TaxID=139045 RepID=UPI002658FE76|nr:single-stranded DNA-binding protein-like [Anopheles coustani]